MLQPLVAVSTDVKHVDNYDWHAAPKQYLEAAIAGAGVFPVLVPSFGDRLDLDQLLASVDGVMLTGSKSNVHPSIYGGEASEANGPYDHARDATTLPLIRKAIDYGVPLLAICRGIQETQRGAGRHAWNRNPGTPRLARPPRAGLRQSGRAFRHSPERLDQARKLPCRRVRPRRDPGQFGPPPGHRPPGSRLQIEAVAEDGTVEAVSVKDARAFAVGVQWHPEYWVHSDSNSAKIFRAFGDAVRAHALARTGVRTAAE